MSTRLLHGDCREVLKTLPSESVHCVVTSPPYFGLRSYGIGTENGEIGLEATPDAFVAEMVAVFREVKRVLRSDGVCFLNLGDSYGAGKQLQGIPWRVAFALQKDGWILRQDIIWSKNNPMPESVRDRCTKAHEYLFLLSKSPRYFYDAEAIREPDCGIASGNGFTGRQGSASYQVVSGGNGTIEPWQPGGGRNKRSVWEVATQPFSEAHFATFPPALIEPCILAGCPAKACEKCGKPWVRETAPSERYAKYLGQGFNDHSQDLEAGMMQNRGVNRQNRMMAEGITCREIVTLGFSPSCSCNAATVPGTVLDPFAGAGTTGLVADRLGRNAILIELNASYADMSKRRITDDAPLFAEVVAA